MIFTLIKIDCPFAQHRFHVCFFNIYFLMPTEGNNKKQNINARIIFITKGCVFFACLLWSAQDFVSSFVLKVYFMCLPKSGETYKQFHSWKGIVITVDHNNFFYISVFNAVFMLCFVSMRLDDKNYVKNLWFNDLFIERLFFLNVIVAVGNSSWKLF